MKYQRHMEIHKKIQKRSQYFVYCHISFKLNHYQKYRKATLRKFYGRHHDLVDRYGISVSQMTTVSVSVSVFTSNVGDRNLHSARYNMLAKIRTRKL
jgi:hypothetical protein